MNDPQKSLCGFINVLKPPGITSAQVVSRVKKLIGGVKVGHAGTLDPEAAGVLPLMIGKATRLFDYIQEKEKSYIAEIAFDCSTDTQDAQGNAVDRTRRYPSEADLQAAMKDFLGEIWQRPPMISAIKQSGKRLYELARAGIQADVPARKVIIHRFDLVRMTRRHGALLSVTCSKGVYIRTLCHDLGQSLGCPAHMRFLLRNQSGVFTLKTARTMEQLEKLVNQGRIGDALLPPETALSHLPSVVVPSAWETVFRNGGRLPWPAFLNVNGTEVQDGGLVCLQEGERLAAIGVRQGDELRTRTWLGEQ